VFSFRSEGTWPPSEIKSVNDARSLHGGHDYKGVETYYSALARSLTPLRHPS
jgi:hypothetical protein